MSRVPPPFDQIFPGFTESDGRREAFEAGFERCRREAATMLREHGHSLAAEKVERMKLVKVERNTGEGNANG